MAAATMTLPCISTEEYLRSNYEPDMDYVDGLLEDRNVGEFDHSLLQRALMLALIKGEETNGYVVMQELRVQVSDSRYRVPDTCLLASNRLPMRIVSEAPLLCIEVLSPEDTFARMRAKCQDYLRMGVPEVWILDPASRTAYILRGSTMTEHCEGLLTVAGTGIELKLSDVFGALDRK